MEIKEYLERFQPMTDEQLIAAFNADVGNPGWVGARGTFHLALDREFTRRGFDYSSINQGGLSLGNKIVLEGKKIKILEI